MKYYFYLFNILMIIIKAADVQKMIQCLICVNMFQKGFNYDEFMKDTTAVDKIRTRLSGYYDPVLLNSSLSKESLDYMTKEITMQYFFKGAETQFDEKTNNQVKTCQPESTCEKVKLSLCESILSLESGLCTNNIPGQESIRVVDNSNKQPSNTPPAVDSNKNNLNVEALAKQFELLQNQQQKPSSNTFQNTLTNQQQMDYLNNLLGSKSPLMSLNNNNGLLNSNFVGYNQLQQNPLLNNPGFNNNMYKQTTPDNISLLQVTQKYLDNNAVNDSNQKQWTPPKPLLLDNFQNNIGEQLKEISLLTT
jgi:hypothetical protein